MESNGETCGGNDFCKARYGDNYIWGRTNTPSAAYSENGCYPEDYVECCRIDDPSWTQMKPSCTEVWKACN